MKNQEYNALKVIALVILIAIAGYFIWTYSGNRGAEQEGRVISNQRVNTGGTTTTKPVVSPGPVYKSTCQKDGAVFSTVSACSDYCGVGNCLTEK